MIDTLKNSSTSEIKCFSHLGSKGVKKDSGKLFLMMNFMYVCDLESIYLYFPPSSQLVYLCFCPVVTSTSTRPVDNVVIATKGLQDRNINTQAGTTVENKGKLILNHIHT